MKSKGRKPERWGMKWCSRNKGDQSRLATCDCPSVGSLVTGGFVGGGGASLDVKVRVQEIFQTTIMFTILLQTGSFRGYDPETENRP